MPSKDLNDVQGLEYEKWGKLAALPVCRHVASSQETFNYTPSAGAEPTSERPALSSKIRTCLTPPTKPFDVSI
jgi:hypothetical protein